MRKYISVLLIFVLLMCSLYGCSDKNVAKNNVITGNIKLSQPQNLVNDEVSQNYWNTVMHNYAKGENGYYYIDSSHYIRFYDTAVNESYVVCNKGNCSHDNRGECNAYVGADGRNPQLVSYMPGTIYYYEGYLYLLDSEGYLVRFTPDCSERKRICKIDNYYPDEERTGTNLVFYKDNVYVYNMNAHLGLNSEYTETIIRYSLDGKNSDTVVEYTGTNSAIWNAKLCGNQLFFQIQRYDMDEKTREIDIDYSGLYVYNLDSGEIIKIFDEQIVDYVTDSAENSIYYYVKSEGLYKYSIADNKKEKIYDATGQNQYAYISCDSKYIYINNSLWVSLAKRAGISVDATVLVIDRSGNEIKSIDSSAIYFIYWGDEEYMFADGRSSNEESFEKYIKKSDILSEAGWRSIK